MDALSDVLRVARLTGGVFLHAEFFAPWCMAARVGPEHCTPALGPASHLILYHYVVEGEFRIRKDRSRQQLRRKNNLLDMRFVIGDNARTTYFAAGAGSRR